MILILVVGIAISSNVMANNQEEMNSCMSRVVLDASVNQTVGELRKKCEDLLLGSPIPQSDSEHPASVSENYSALKRRQEIESRTEYEPFVLTPHKTNYILFAAYNFSSPNEEPFATQFPNEELSIDNTEAKFQLSIKFPVIDNLLNTNGDVYIGYTNRSFWQVYNEDASAPFRETNHEPEAWIRFRNDWEFMGFRNLINDIGFVHQSNGRSGALSRSWNRIYAQSIFQKDNFFLAFKPWWRIPEDEDEDDNPDIDDYLGNFELGGLYKLEQHSFGLVLRNNLRLDDNRGSAQLDWSFPLNKRLRGYIQWFNGYGESLIDYNANVNSIGVGLQLTDWL